MAAIIDEDECTACGICERVPKKPSRWATSRK